MASLTIVREIARQHGADPERLRDRIRAEDFEQRVVERRAASLDARNVVEADAPRRPYPPQKIEERSLDRVALGARVQRASVLPTGRMPYGWLPTRSAGIGPAAADRFA